jgi:hypothetical protein
MNFKHLQIPFGSLLLIYFGFFLQLTVNAIGNQDFNIDFKDKIYRDHIKTVQLFPSNDILAFPAILLQSRQTLELHFDDLKAQSTTYNYTIVHCNADWTPSDLMKSQYLEGYQDYFITEFAYSFNTYVPYTHYSLRIPNAQIQPILSGNYLLVVYKDKVDEPILTKRFVIYEEIANFSGRIRRPSKVETMDTHQELDFNLNHSGYEIPNAFTDLHVSLLQNQSWASSIDNLKPRFIQNYLLNYDFDLENQFPGGNEWRVFDTKDDRNLSMNIRKIELDTNLTYYLETDQSRAINRYTTWDDINGMFVIRTTTGTDNQTESDYVWVDFFLKIEEPFRNEDAYVTGAFSNWTCLESYKMTYDYSLGVYRKKILLKQGYYNYMYSLAESPNSGLSLDDLEGNHWETENSYQLIAYHREIGLRYDRVIAFSQFSSSDLY